LALSTQHLLGIAAVALLGFWMLGAYNRLVALRNGIIAAWTQVDEPLQRRAAALQPLVDELRTHLPDEHVALDAVLAAQVRLQAAADAMRARPATAPRAAALAAAETTLQAALSRLLALLDQRSHLAGADVVAAHLAVQRDATQRLAFARQMFNDAVGTYNEAVQQFPTRLLSRLFGFGAAGAL
jgi:LemA protein